jgi:hypothetical protein
VAERVQIARYLEPLTATAAAFFLSRCGFDAVDLDQSGKGSSAGAVLVVRDQADAARAVLDDAVRGRFAETSPRWSEAAAAAAADLVEALHGSGYRGAKRAWLDVFPIFAIIGVLIAVIILLATVPSLADFSLFSSFQAPDR